MDLDGSTVDNQLTLNLAQLVNITRITYDFTIHTSIVDEGCKPTPSSMKISFDENGLYPTQFYPKLQCLNLFLFHEKLWGGPISDRPL